MATTPSPGRYTTVSGTETFEPHTADGTWGAPVTPTITGALPGGTARTWLLAKEQWSSVSWLPP